MKMFNCDVTLLLLQNLKHGRCIHSVVCFAIHLPGHITLCSHGSISSAAPLHLAPPYSGGGLVHVRGRLCVPFPHVTEQACHSDHVAQPPSTDKQQYQKCVTNCSDDRKFDYFLCNLDISKKG